MSWLLPVLVAGPLLGAALTLVFGRRLMPQRIVTLSVVAATAGGAIALLLHVDDHGPVTAQMGGWPAPLGITLIADRFSAIVLSVSTLMLMAVLVYAMAQLGRDAIDWWFHTKYLTLTAGVTLSLLTGDLFNLFVGFEVMLVSSYVLLTVRSTQREIRSTMSYVVINLVASALFLVTIAFTYGISGTMNLADLSMRLADVDPAANRTLSLLMLVVFGIKAALFPLFMWLPDSYPTAPTPVTAIFAGLLTKVGVFVIIRTQTLLFPADEPSGLLLFVAGATMTVGVLGAIAQNDVKRILSFHIVSQIGYMIMGLGLLSIAGLAVRLQDLAERARTKKLNPEDVQDGTFTITNPGQFGGLFGLPIINQPQVAILGIGGIEKRPVVIDDAIAIRSMMYMAMSYDHRVVDGAVADQFLAEVKAGLQDFDESLL